MRSTPGKMRSLSTSKTPGKRQSFNPDYVGTLPLSYAGSFRARLIEGRISCPHSIERQGRSLMAVVHQIKTAAKCMRRVLITQSSLA